MNKEEKVEAKNSKIHGKGLFATQKIKQGETILLWKDNSSILTREEADSLPSAERCFLSFIDGQFILFKNFSRCINHSCDPNAKGFDGRDYALRDIGVGEEITVDYIEEQVPDLNIKCNCGSPRCRKRLVTVKN